MVMALIVIAASVGWLTRSCRSSSRKPVEAYEAYIASQLAAEAIRLSEAGHPILLLLPAGASEVGRKLVVESFARTVQMANKDMAMQIEQVSANPLLAQAGEPAIAADEFSRALAQHPDCAVVASIAGLPDVAGLTNQPLPKLVVLCATTTGVGPLLETGAVAAAIVPRGQPATVQGNSPAARFEREYEIKRADKR